MKLAIHQKDIGHLGLFKSALQSNHPISVYRASIAEFSIANKYFYDRLEQLGCLPNKTFIVKYPTIELSDRDFIRGYFDGDGCFYLNKKTKEELAFLLSAGLSQY